jgi:hypothetical protein
MYGLDVLLVSRDRKLIPTIESACTNLSLGLVPCPGSLEALAFLARRKFYAVIVDCDDPNVADGVLSAFRTSRSSKNAVSIAAVQGSAAMPQAAFVMTKPVAGVLALRTLRVAVGVMLQEYGRYFRHPVELPVTITTDSGQELQVTSINLSHGGLAVHMVGSYVIATDGAARARFVLPGLSTGIETKGKVAWVDSQGRAGLRCEGVSQAGRTQLEQWLAPRLPDVCPGLHPRDTGVASRPVTRLTPEQR